MSGSQSHGPRSELAERMAAAARDLQEQGDPQATYRMSTELAVNNVDGCEAASLSIVRRRRTVETQGSTSEAARYNDELQSEVGEGPCLDAVWDHFMVHGPDLGADERWPTWGPRVVEETGMRSILSFRLFTHGDTLGALNMYSSHQDAFHDEDRVEGVALAAHIAVAVTAAQHEEDLTSALASRTVISQATGMLMERYGLTADVAFTTLARVASTDNVKVRDLAQEFVRTGQLRSPEHQH